MKSTKAVFYSAIMMLCLFFTVNNTYASNTEPASGPTLKEHVATMTTAEREARITQMKQRVQEIKAMDKSQLSREDKKALRKELRDMNKESRAMGGGTIYISLGAAIIIVLLIILIVR